MSAIATFHRFREADLPGLREAAGSRERLLAAELFTFDGSGHIFGTLLTYLEEKRAIDLMKSSHDDLAHFLFETRGSTFFVLTTEHRRRYLAALDPAAFDEIELRDYHDEFTEADEPGSGELMMDGIKALRAALDAVQEGSVVLLQVG